MWPVILRAVEQEASNTEMIHDTLSPPVNNLQSKKLLGRFTCSVGVTQT